MAGPPERDKEANERQKRWAKKNVRSSLSPLAKRLKHTDWSDQSEEEHF